MILVLNNSHQPTMWKPHVGWPRLKNKSSYFWQKSCPQFLQWWRRSVREKRTVQPEQLSTTSSFTQWSAAERPGWSLTDQLKTRPRPSPTRILLWSLRRGENDSKLERYLPQMARLWWVVCVWTRRVLLLGDGEGCDLGRVSVVLAIKRRVHCEFTPEDQLALPSVAWAHRKTRLNKQHLNNETRTVVRQAQRLFEESIWGIFNLRSSPEGFSRMPTCPELVIRARVQGGRLEGCWALARVSRMRVGNLSLALRVVDEHEAVLLVDAERVWPAVGIVRAAVHRPRRSRPGWRTYSED